MGNVVEEDAEEIVEAAETLGFDCRVKEGTQKYDLSCSREEEVVSGESYFTGEIWWDPF